MLDEANENIGEYVTHAIDKSTSTDVDFHDHENEVHKKEDVEQN